MGLLPLVATGTSPLGEKAHFGIILLNESPTGDTADYRLKFLNSYDSVNKSSYEYFECGQPGNIAGLDHMFHHSFFIADIPYLKYVEIPVTFAETGLCSVYNKIDLQIMASCEMSTKKSQVYQYGEEYNPSTGEMNVQYDVRRAAENSTATIDKIIWDPATTILSNAAEGDDSSLASYYGDLENGRGMTVRNVDREEMLPLSPTVSVDLDQDGQQEEPAGVRQKSSEIYLTPTVPIRSDAEREALRKSLESLDACFDIPKLIPSKVVASNVTSQFRLLIIEEDSGRVEVRRTGLGWGRDVTVAAVKFSDQAAFEEFLQSGSFSAVKYVLIQSALEQKELPFPRPPAEGMEE